MTRILKQYILLADALNDLTNAAFPDQEAEEYLEHIRKTCPDATHVVLCANIDTASPRFGMCRVIPVGPRQEYKSVEDVETIHLLEPEEMEQYPVAYVKLEKWK